MNGLLDRLVARAENSAGERGLRPKMPSYFAGMVDASPALPFEMPTDTEDTAVPWPEEPVTGPVESRRPQASASNRAAADPSDRSQPAIAPWAARKKEDDGLPAPKVRETVRHSEIHTRTVVTRQETASQRHDPPRPSPAGVASARADASSSVSVAARKVGIGVDVRSTNAPLPVKPPEPARPPVAPPPAPRPVRPQPEASIETRRARPRTDYTQTVARAILYGNRAPKETPRGREDMPEARTVDPKITVRIGRITVMPPPAAQKPSVEEAWAPALSLEQYLSERMEGKR